MPPAGGEICNAPCNLQMTLNKCQFCQSVRVNILDGRILFLVRSISLLAGPYTPYLDDN